MKSRRYSDDPVVIDLQVALKSLDWNSKKKLDLFIRVVNDDREKLVYETFISDVKDYLDKRKMPISKYLSIPTNFLIDKDKVVENVDSASIEMFMIENPTSLGYSCLSSSHDIDYELSVLAVSTLARFHAVSFCFRKERKIQLDLEYLDIARECSAPEMSKQELVRLEIILKTNKEFMKHADMFLSSMKDKRKKFGMKIEQFGVLCHGKVVKENIYVKKESDKNGKPFYSGLLFSDLSHCLFASCTLDLLQFIFTVIDPTVRENFMADLVCSVYYDSFVRSVTEINEEICVFSKKEFIKEFDSNIMYGFLFALKQCSNEHLDALDREKVTSGAFAKHKDQILSVMRDVVQFRSSARLTMR